MPLSLNYVSKALLGLVCLVAIAARATPSRSIADEALVELLATEGGQTIDAAGNLVPHPVKALTANDGRMPATMVLIPASANESCPAFLAARYEVTNFEYAEFLRATNERRFPRHWNGGRFSAGEANFPVTNISREDAFAYCAWLSSRSGPQILLPTAAQARRLQQGASRDAAKTSRIGVIGADRYDMNSWGCYDVLGNAREISMDDPAGAADPRLGFRLVMDAAPSRDDPTSETVHASVIVTTPAPTPTPSPYFGPAFTLHPESKAVSAGSAVTLSSSATLFPSSGAVAYQWYFNDAAIPGANLPSYTLSNVQAANVGIYYVEATTPTMTSPNIRQMQLQSGGNPNVEVATESVERVFSDPAIIAIGLNGTPPSIVRQPANITVLRGETALVTATFTGTPPLATRWRIQQSTDFVNYSTVTQPTDFQATSNETSATASYRNPPLGTITRLELVVFGAYGKVTSSIVEIRTIAEGTAPVITTQPRSQTVTRGNSAGFQVVATGAPTPIYQWYRNGLPVAGADSAALTLTNVQDSELGSYTVTATNSLGTVTSAPATLSLATSGATGSNNSSGGGGGTPSWAFLAAAALLALSRAARGRRAIRAQS